MKIVYAGTPQYAVAPLKALVENGFEVIAVVTQEDRPVGRRARLTPPPVKQYAQERGIPVYQFHKIREHVEELRAIGGDIMFTCAYGQILSRAVLESFALGVWNAHASLLPEFRGASPVQSAILAGKTQTGVTIMKTEEKLDAGDILLVKRCDILPGETAGELAEKLSLLSAEAVCEAAKMIEAGDSNILLQDDSAATYCKKIAKEDARADFSQSAAKVCALINAMSPSPAAYATLAGAQVNFYRAFEEPEEDGTCGQVVRADKRGIVIKCGGGCVRITEAQFAGGKRLSAADIVNGRKISAGDIFE
ncbi:MAG TPA: methionyl-tRNA formyltransferase [Candidatus Coproplasma excrementavium]|nr:methionyl-tRNA formyltransferase [Candidatus Coproplasma excrementavium]